MDDKEYLQLTKQADIENKVVQLINNEYKIVDIPELTTIQACTYLKTRTNKELDMLARTHGYNNLNDLCDYSASDDEKHKLEGQFGVNLKEKVTQKVKEICLAITSERRAIPTWDYFLKELPDMTYPVIEATDEDKENMLQTQEQFTKAMQTHLDSKAQERGYDNIFTVCTYINSTVDKFRAEAEACVSWRDEIWRRCYEILAEVQSGQRGIPTMEELLAELPILIWPE